MVTMLKESLKTIEKYKSAIPHYGELLDILGEILILREEYKKRMQENIFPVNETLLKKKLEGGLPLIDFSTGQFDLKEPKQYFLALLTIAEKRAPGETKELMQKVKNGTLVCLPMQHWSRRIGQGLNETLWASFLLITPTAKIYFGGDTGYFIGHREIGKRYPGIDYALLPTTAYHPRWFMHYAHMDIDEALAAFDDLGARTMIPHQWGTFHLGDEPVGYSALELKRKITGQGLDSSRFIILNIGEIHPITTKKPKSIRQ